MALAKPTQITVPFSSNGVKNTIPETATGSNLASMQEGFPVITMTDVDQGGMPPQGQDMNGILFDVTKAIQYQQAGGLFPYDATFAQAIDGYPLGALLTSADGSCLYQNTVSGNVSDPDNGGQGWSQILSSASIAGKQDKLTPVQMDAVNSGITSARVAIYDSYAAGKQDTLTFDNTPTEGSLNPVTSDGIATALSLKQDNITVDSVPTEGSTNPVQSGGVYDALAEKVDISGGNSSATVATATGSTTARTLANRFADVINIKDYGAVGDGVTDDTAAIQAAINSGKSIWFPSGRYLISQTLNVSTRGQTFYGMALPYNAEHFTEPVSGVICLANDLNTAFNVSINQAGFHSLGFKGTGTGLQTAIKFARSEQTITDDGVEYQIYPDDIDCIVTDCIFYGFAIALDVTGRSLTCLDSSFSGTHTAIKLDWDETTATAKYEHYYSSVGIPPYANRALRVVRCRKHGVGSMVINGSATTNYATLIKNEGIILRSAIIVDNLCDVGSSLLIDEGGLDSCLISGNITDLNVAASVAASALISSTAKIFNTRIVNNTISCFASKDTSTVTDSVRFPLIDLKGTIDGLAIDRNLFQGCLRRIVQIGDNSGKTVKNLSLSNNQFDISGIDPTAFAPSILYIDCTVTNLDFSHNSVSYDSQPSNISNVFAIYINTTSSHVNTKLTTVTFKSNELAGISFCNTNYTVKIADVRYQEEESSVGIFGTTGVTIKSNASVSPYTTSGLSLGDTDHRWSQLYAATSTIDTSDERLKENIRDINDDVLDAWGDVNIKVFQFKDAIESKGESARLHTGVIAQQVQEAFASHGIDAFRYGLLCYDEWEDEYKDERVLDVAEVLDEEGNVITPEQTHIERVKVREAGSIFSIRYAEALILEAAYQRRRADRIEARLAALEERMR